MKRTGAFVVLLAVVLASLAEIGVGADDATALTLRGALEMALARDALVRDAKQSLEVARDSLIRAKALTPKLSVSSNTNAASTGGLDPNSAITGTSYSSQSYTSSIVMPMRGGTSLSLSTGAATTTTNASLRTGEGSSFTYASALVGASLSKPLPLFRNEKVLTEGGRWTAEIAFRNAELALEDARRRVAGDTFTYFLAAVRAQRQAEIAEASQREAEELLRIAQEKLKVGKIAEIDVMEAQVAADSARTTTRNAQSAAATAFDTLKNFLGLPLQQTVQASYEETAALPAPSAEEDRLLAQALAQRADLKQRALDVQAADLTIKQAQANARPGVFLNGGYSRSGQAGTITESFGQLTDPSWFVGLTTTAGLTHKEDRAVIAQARSSLGLARQNEQLAKDDVRLEIRRALRDVQDTAVNAALLADTVKHAEENLHIRQVQFEHGLVKPLDVMQTERQLNETRNQRLNALIDYQLARARLSLAIGEEPTADLPAKASAKADERG